MYALVPAMVDLIWCVHITDQSWTVVPLGIFILFRFAARWLPATVLQTRYSASGIGPRYHYCNRNSYFIAIDQLVLPWFVSEFMETNTQFESVLCRNVKIWSYIPQFIPSNWTKLCTAFEEVVPKRVPVLEALWLYSAGTERTSSVMLSVKILLIGLPRRQGRWGDFSRNLINLQSPTQFGIQTSPGHMEQVLSRLIRVMNNVPATRTECRHRRRHSLNVWIDCDVPRLLQGWVSFCVRFFFWLH